MKRSLLIPMLLGLLAACGDDEFALDVPPSEDQVEYTVTLTGAPTQDVEDLAEETLALYRRQEDGAASPAFLRRRADDDLDTLRTILQSEGYYQPTIERIVTGSEDGAPLDVELRIDPGTAFELASHDFLLRGEAPAGALPTPADLGSPIGAPAQAILILEAEDAAVATLRGDGYAYAEFVDRSAVADPDSGTVRVRSTIATGDRHTFGPVTYVGLTSVEEEYLDTYITWQPGQTYDALTLSEFQQDLVRTELFDTVTAEPPEEAPGVTALPITVTVDERKRRTGSIGLRFDTEAGVTLALGFEHRNLLGRNEKLEFDVEFGRDDSTADISFRIPQFRRDGQILTLSTRFEDIEEDAYDGTSLILGAGIERELNDRWRAGISAVVEQSEVDEAGVNTEIDIVGAPTFLAFDNTADPLDPRDGLRARLVVSPFIGEVNGGDTSFVRIDGRASAYLPLNEDKTLVLANRVRVGSIVADSVADVPITRRLFSGGGGSVRGFASRSLGPEDANGDARGGLSVVELGTELRFPLFGDLGGVVFAEAGQVSDNTAPEFDDLRSSVGGGVRYYSPIGPVRADLAFPIDPDANEDAFQFYLSIGQAF